MTKSGRKGPGRDSTSAKAIATAERHAEWLRARKRGESYREIAARDGVHHNSVWEAVRSALNDIRDEPAEELRKFELECLDDLIAEAHQEIDEPEVRIEAVRKLRADRRKILGTDAPTKVQDVTPREELWTRAREWFLNPTPELEAVLAECGWQRVPSSAGGT